MKKLLLATIMASMTFGVTAGPQFNRVIDFDNLGATSEKEIEIDGVVPQRCLLRIGNNGANPDDVLANAALSSDNSVQRNNKVLIANLRAWCNYDTNMVVKFDSYNDGLQGPGNNKIAYRLIANDNQVFDTRDGNRGRLKIEGTGQHLVNSIEKVPLYIRPVKAGFAKAGDYKDTITVTLKAR